MNYEACYIWALCLLFGLFACSPVTRNAVLRSLESEKLAACIGEWPYERIPECTEAARTRCKGQGLEANCAIDGM